MASIITRLQQATQLFRSIPTDAEFLSLRQRHSLIGEVFDLMDAGGISPRNAMKLVVAALIRENLELAKAAGMEPPAQKEGEEYFPFCAARDLFPDSDIVGGGADPNGKNRDYTEGRKDGYAAGYKNGQDDAADDEDDWDADEEEEEEEDDDDEWEASDDDTDVVDDDDDLDDDEPEAITHRTETPDDAFVEGTGKDEVTASALFANNAVGACAQHVGFTETAKPR
jgi:hypothetical protein